MNPYAEKIMLDQIEKAYKNCIIPEKTQKKLDKAETVVEDIPYNTNKEDEPVKTVKRGRPKSV